MLTDEEIIKLALDANLLNYIDNETPRYYFIRSDADLNTVLKFAKLIIDDNNLISRDDCRNWYHNAEYEDWLRDECVLADKTN